MAETIIETIDLRKNYDGVAALRGLTLRVPAGSICGFLGRNGAGKTTTMKILLGLARPSGGTARVFDLPADDAAASLEIRKRAAFVSEEKELDPSMTAEEMIRFVAAVVPKWRGDLEERYVRTFSIPVARRIKALSRGTRTQLALLLALCRGAELLVIDEPTSGLDPAMAEQVLQALVRHASAENTTVFFSSHQLADVEQICDRVAIIDHGRCVVEGGLDDVRERFRRVQMVFDSEAPAAEFRSPDVVRVSRSGRVLTIVSDGSAESVVEEARALHPRSVDTLPMTLKDIFLEAAGADE